MAVEPGVKRMGEAKEIEVPTRGSLPNKGTRQGGPPRKEWVRGISLKIQLVALSPTLTTEEWEEWCPPKTLSGPKQWPWCPEGWRRVAVLL